MRKLLLFLMFPAFLCAQVQLGKNVQIGGSPFQTLTTTGTNGAATLTSGVLNIPQYQGSLTLTTTGTSGAATLSGNVLNIPQYAGGISSLNGLTGALNLTSSDSSVTITPSGSNIDLKASGGGGGGGGGANQWLFEAGKNGATCDGVTDDTTALNNLLTTVYTAGGGEILVQGTCLISGQINVPNNGASTNPTQPTIRITGDSGGSANGAWTTPPATSGTLDMRYNATYGKILTLGQGKLEIDHLTLKDGGTDCAPFIYTTNTTLSVHDNLFSGTASGSSACNDGIILGGTTTTIATLAPTDAFQGYNTYIQHNYFDKIRRGVYEREFADAVTVKDNTWSANCGATNTAAAVEIGVSGDTSSARGNVFSGNLYEATHYSYVIWSHADGNQFFGETFWDAGGSTLYAFHFTDSTQNNFATVYTDASFSLSQVSDSNQPNGPNTVLNQAMEQNIGRAASQYLFCNASGSGTAQSCTTSPTYTPTNGMVILFKSSTTNSSSAFTLNVNSSGAASVVKNGNNSALNGSDIPANTYVPMIYNGSQWEMYFTTTTPRQWSCQPGLGDGLNAIPAGTYLQTTCMNTTGSTVTLTGLKCYSDGGSSTLNASGNTLGALLTGAITCSSSFAAGTQSSNVSLANGDYINFTFVADGATKQTTWVVTGTYLR